MPVILVHGNPESAQIWGPLLSALADRGVTNVTTLSPPGFGVQMPPDWTPSMATYRDWLIDELERLGGGVDLVGHDWGAGHTYGLLAHRPDLVRSWAADCAGLLHEDYRWHGFARLWQMPWIGELSVALMARAPVWLKARILRSLGMSNAVIPGVAPALDADMGRCILGLYRSAAQPALRRLGADLDRVAHTHGLVLIPTADPYPGTPAMAEAVARQLGAATVELPGAHHWWMFDHAATAADALIDHWREAPT